MAAISNMAAYQDGVYSKMASGSNNRSVQLSEADTAFQELVELRMAEWQAEYDAATAGQAAAPPVNDLHHETRLAAAELNAPITLQETHNAILAAKNGKAVGIDNVANEIIKLPVLQGILHKLYQTCFEKNLIPSIWYKAIIQPILKRGKDPLLPLNHRGISLMSTVAKIFSAIINKRLSDYLENHKIYAEEQNGFRRLRSCLDHLFTLTTVIRNRKMQKLPTYCAFIDFEKAFDSVNHTFLWFKMSACGIHGKLLNIVRTMYANLQNCVRVGGRLTDWFAQAAGVRQGDTLAPTLFALYINDLAPEINELGCGVCIGEDTRLSILLYADDIVLLSESPDDLQAQLDVLNNWSTRWKLGINTDKTQIVHFRRASDPITQFVFKLGLTPLDLVTSYRYLGLDITDTLDYTGSVTTLCKAASRALGSVTCKYFAIDGLDYDTYTNMYNALVCPVMDYACELWGDKKRDSCATIQHRAMRTFLGVNKCTPLPMMYGDMGWTPTHVRHQVGMVRYWIRLTKMPDTRLNKRVFNWDYDLASHGWGTWCKGVKTILDTCGSSHIFADKSSGPSNLVDMVKRRLELIAAARRRNEMMTMSRMNFYRQLADVRSGDDTLGLKPVTYVTLPLSRHQRAAIARLRGGTLRLAVETGRYRQVPADERLCQQCDTGVVETAEHFLFHCPKYVTNRRNLFESLLDTDNLDTLFSSRDSIFKTAKYVMQCMKDR